MRPTFKEVLKRIEKALKERIPDANACRVLKQELQNFSEDQERIKRIYKVELMVEAFKRCFPNSPLYIKDIWSVLLNHKGILPKAKTPHLLDILRLHFKVDTSDWSFDDDVQFYMNLPLSDRAYQYDKTREENNYLTAATSVPLHREFLYNLFFEVEFHQHKNTKIPPVLRNDEIRIQIDFGLEGEDGFNQQWYDVPIPIRAAALQNLPNHLERVKKEHKGNTNLKDALLQELKLGIRPQPKQRNTQLLQLLKDIKYPISESPFNNAISYMDKNGARYESIRSYLKGEANYTIRRKRNKESYSYVRYKRINNIIGRTGSGKNTHLELDSVRIVRDHHGKVGILCTKVQDCINLVEKLRHLGIRAIPIIGDSSLQEHFADKLEAKKNRGSNNPYHVSLNEVKDDSMLRFYSNDCILKDLIGLSHLKKLPCTSLYVGAGERRVKRSCPFFMKCGACTKDRELAEAQIWIATIESFFKSKPKPIFNEEGKTYAEIAYTELDVLFVDEVDSQQERADGLTIGENEIIGHERCQFENEMLTIRNNIANNFSTANSPIYNQFFTCSSQATQIARILFGLIMDSSELRDNIENRSFSIYEMINESFCGFFNNQDLINDHPYIQMLIDYEPMAMNRGESKLQKKFRNRVEAFLNRIASIKMDTVLDYPERRKAELKEVTKLIKFMMTQLNLKMTKPLTEYNKTLFCFALVLKGFDSLYKKMIYLMQNYNLFGDSQIDAKYASIRTYLPFIPEAVTERNFQYQYQKDSQSSDAIGVFKMYQYLGVGRSLLLDYPYLYKEIDRMLGPAMVYLSATSRAPGSVHYDINKEVDYIIESTQNSKAKMDFFLSRIQGADKQYYGISGTKNNGYKLKKLRDMSETKHLRDLIEEEIEYWRQKGENRAVLLITNSYLQAKVVTEGLAQYFGKGEVLFLNNGEYKGVPSISKGLVEQFPEFKAIVLVSSMKTISTGYNVVQNDGSGKSFFGSVLFLVRPMPTPGSIQDILKILNGKREDFMKAARKQGKFFYEGSRYLKSRSLYLMKELTDNDKSFFELPKDTRRLISWYVFKDVRQTIGRLQRGDTDCRVHLVDGSWYIEGEHRPMTILNEFKKMLDENRSEELEVLYSDSYEAINRLLESRKKKNKSVTLV